jgi:GNAT superfamily N-acetyltransferase
MSQTSTDTDTGSVRVLPADPSRWDEVVAVMGERGDAASCWCQYFRLRGRQWTGSTREDNRDALEEQVCHGSTPPGLVALLDGEPVGWCAVAPKRDYPRVVASRITGPDLDGIWAVTCFVVRPGFRRHGIARAMLDAAVDFARDRGARTVEGYPVDTAISTRASAGELYHGTLGMFTGAGFDIVSRPTRMRVLVRRRLS